MTREEKVTFIAQLEGYIREANKTPRPPGGQQAGIDRSWACRIPLPSVLSELRWYARCFEDLVKSLREEWDIHEEII